ncbi:hypothetical protein AB0R12_32485 [Streptomyces niveus]|uniref:hypothetical protein n=1 Tax=Streptomyces niveus TaxID=193462 RepID=UPI0034369D9A
MFIFVVLGLMLFILAIIWAVLGVHGLLLGRMPGHWLQQRVRQPRLWGAGALLMLVSWYVNSPSLLAVGIGLVVLGHVVKPTP